MSALTDASVVPSHAKNLPRWNKEKTPADLDENFFSQFLSQGINSI